MKMTWEISWADMCRVCMEVEEVLLPLFDETYDDDLSFSDKLSNIAPLEINKSDGLPNKVCANCAQSINSFLDFKKLILESDQKLRRMFNLQTVPETESDVGDVNSVEENECQGYADICDIQNSTKALQSIHEETYSESALSPEKIRDVQISVMENLLADSLIQNNEPNAKLQSNDQNLRNESHAELVVASNADTHHKRDSSVQDVDNEMVKAVPAITQTSRINSEVACAKRLENDDSDCDSYFEIGENIVGSINDSVTKVREIKENGKIVQYQCTLCSQNYQKLSGALSHIINLHVPITGPFYCVICEMDCDSIEQLKSHVKTHSGPAPYICFICQKSYILRRYLKRHMACHTDFPRHRCVRCGKRFLTKNELDDHIPSHADQGTGFKCSQCGKKFAHKGNYKRHLITHLDPLRLHLPKFPCMVCQKRFVNNRTLEIHMRVHTGEKPFHCEICGRFFSQQGNLMLHKKLHTNSRDFTCEVCGKSFNQKATLKDHAKIHSGEKPYVCNVCGVAFTFSTALRRHMWTHSDGKPHECDVCGAKFTGKYDLNRHMKIHFGRSKKKSNNHTVDQASLIEVPEEFVHIFEETSQSDPILVEQIFLCDDAIQIIPQEDPEKENVDCLLDLV